VPVEDNGHLYWKLEGDGRILFQKKSPHYDTDSVNLRVQKQYFLFANEGLKFHFQASITGHKAAHKMTQPA
jgi:hypothetical protein